MADSEVLNLVAVVRIHLSERRRVAVKDDEKGGEYMARKRLKKKRRSCAMCKPFKMRGAIRWKPRDQFLLRLYEQDKD